MNDKPLPDESAHGTERKPADPVKPGPRPLDDSGGQPQPPPSPPPAPPGVGEGP